MKTKTGSNYERYLKRFLDVFLCFVALLVLSPLFLITAIGIKASSAGPVFYASDRNGQWNRPFHFYKFRSMHQADGRDKGMCVADADRLFRFGRLIRRLKIDELPQLLNVIRGDMSIVGPRPMVPGSGFYSGAYEEITAVRPGLTSAASLYDYTVGDTYSDDAAYRKEVLPVKLELELYYVRHQSFGYDVNLVLRTIGTILAVILRLTPPAQPELEKVHTANEA